MNTGSPVQNDLPKTPSSHPQQRTPVSSGMMSSSLKERLKKCGRYHPATPPSSRTSNPTLSVTQRQLPRKILVETTHLHKNALSSNEATKVDHEIKSSRDVKKCSTEFLEQSYSSTATFSHKPQSHSIKVDSAMAHRSLEEESPAITFDLSVTHSDHKMYDNLKSDECLPARDCETLEQHCYSNQTLGSPTKSDAELQIEKRQLQILLREHRETLRKLQMVKTYRKKNNLTELQGLINKWRSACQQAVLDLHRLLPDPRPSLSQLVQQLGIDGRLVGFDEVEECFI